jgi:pyruvate kinase
MRRIRHTKIIATLGPSSNTPKMIESLFLNGVDLFRLNFSHGTHADHRLNIEMIRDVEHQQNRPIGIIADLQGPKLRVGVFEEGKVCLKVGQTFTLDLDKTPGNAQRVCLPHVEIFKALEVGTDLLLDDGKIRLKITSFTHQKAVTEVIVGGVLSNRKGVNVPDVMLPISALTAKDREDLEFALSHGVDFIALSFVQKSSDIEEARELIKGRAAILSKLEKPMALQNLDAIIAQSDGVMVARGDLGVELPPEDVPAIQRRIIRSCRDAGKPVIVATQMLESMITVPTPTRAEASDVATAVYDGVDAVMLSAESASGQYPIEAVSIMHRIIKRTEQDPLYVQTRSNETPSHPQTVTDSIAAAAHQVSKTINVTCIVTFTESGFTTLRVARERPLAPILALTTIQATARVMTLVWGVHTHLVSNIYSFSQMVEVGCKCAKVEEFSTTNDKIIVTAGVPFGQSGGTNILRVATIDVDEVG